MARNAESPGAAIPGLSRNVVTGFYEQAAGTALQHPPGHRRYQ
jgi:hypothetical protein